jgi:hypothetical protein
LLTLLSQTLVAAGDDPVSRICRAISMGPQDFIAAQGSAGGPYAAVASVSSGSRSSFESNVSRCREVRDLIREASEARGRYSDATREVGRLEADLAAVQAVLRALEEETTLARAETTDVHAQAAGAFLTPSAFACFPPVSVLEVIRGAELPVS